MHHEIAERKSPVSFVVTCTCGWRFQTPRRQNALARAAKVKAAIRKHLEEDGK